MANPRKGNPMKVFFVSLFAVLALLSNETRAADPPTKNSEANASAQAIRTAQSEQLAVVKAELAATKAFQEQLLSTVYWSLAAIITLAVLLIGFGWFANFRVYERDKESLTREMRTAVEEGALATKKELSTFATDTRTEVVRMIEEFRDKVQAGLEKGMEQQNSSLRSAISEAVAGETRARSRLERSLQSLQLDVYEQDHERWLNNGVHINALRTSKKMLEIGLEIGFSYRTAQLLDQVASDLKQIERGGDVIPAILLTDLITLLDRVKDAPGDFAQQLKTKALALGSGQ